MTTMRHQYLATWFYSDETIQEVLNNNKVHETDESTDTSMIVVVDDKKEEIQYANEYERQILEKDPEHEDYKIIKIEEPIYTTVYEKKEILDEAEKRYLSNFIRPFRDNVKYIKKTHYRYEKSKIEICVNGYIEEANISDTYYTFLPAFSTNEMYNGMTLEKEYTLEELGL